MEAVQALKENFVNKTALTAVYLYAVVKERFIPSLAYNLPPHCDTVSLVRGIEMFNEPAFGLRKKFHT